MENENENKNKKNCGPQPMFMADEIELTICHMRIISLNQDCVTRKDMCNILGVAIHTIDSHFNHVYTALKLKEKLPSDAKLATALLKWSMKHGFRDGGYFQDTFLFDGVAKHPFGRPNENPEGGKE